MQTIVSDAFLDLKLPGSKEMISILKRDIFWEVIVGIMKPIYPALRILRMADSKQFAMDKVMYCLLRTDIMLDKGREEMDSLITKRKVQDLMKAIGRVTKQGINAEFIHNISTGSDTDTDSDSDDDNSPTTNSLSSNIIFCWERRKKQIINPYVVTSWMLSPVQEIMEDAIENHNADHRNIVSELLVKLFLPFENYPGKEEEYNNEKNKMLDTFWEEHNQFTTKTGVFSHQQYMWHSSDLNNNRTHLWHKKNTLKCTRFLGRLACLVCSKPLGIDPPSAAGERLKVYFVANK